MPALRMRIVLFLTVAGEPRQVEVTYDATDVRAFEEATGESYLGNLTATAAAWCAHHRAVREGKLDGELKDFEVMFGNLDNLGGGPVGIPLPPAAEEEPTPAARGADSSAS